MKKIIYSLVILAISLFSFNVEMNAAPVVAPTKPVAKTIPQKPATKTTSQAKTVTTAPVIQNVSALSLVDAPEFYLNKTVSFTGEFVSFTSLGLDYKPAFRDSTKYIGILMRRDDVKKHTIPLSELKMFMIREKAQKIVDIETGDKFQLTGKVFSTALGDPWLEITEFKITDKKNKDTKDNKNTQNNKETKK